MERLPIVTSRAASEHAQSATASTSSRCTRRVPIRISCRARAGERRSQTRSRMAGYRSPPSRIRRRSLPPAREGSSSSILSSPRSTMRPRRRYGKRLLPILPRRSAGRSRGRGGLYGGTCRRPRASNPVPSNEFSAPRARSRFGHRHSSGKARHPRRPRTPYPDRNATVPSAKPAWEALNKTGVVSWYETTGEL